MVMVMATRSWSGITSVHIIDGGPRRLSLLRKEERQRVNCGSIIRRLQKPIARVISERVKVCLCRVAHMAGRKVLRGISATAKTIKPDLSTLSLPAYSAPHTPPPAPISRTGAVNYHEANDTIKRQRRSSQLKQKFNEGRVSDGFGIPLAALNMPQNQQRQLSTRPITLLKLTGKACVRSVKRSRHRT